MSELKKSIEQKALELGASSWAVRKWRQRGIPSYWKIKLLTDGGCTIDELDQFRGAASSSSSPRTAEPAA